MCITHPVLLHIVRQVHLARRAPSWFSGGWGDGAEMANDIIA